MSIVCQLFTLDAFSRDVYTQDVDYYSL